MGMLEVPTLAAAEGPGQLQLCPRAWAEVAERPFWPADAAA